MERAYKLKKEYSASGVPTVIADEEFKIIWKNDAGGSVSDISESADFVFDGGEPVTGLVTRKIGGKVCTFNVIKTADDGNNKTYYIIELISSAEPGGIVSAEAVRRYIGYICSKIRAAAGNITSVTDRLFEDISAGVLDAGRAAEGFDRIYESAAMLEREIVYPDRIYSLIEPQKHDDIIILDREMTAVAAGIKSSFNGSAQSSSLGSTHGTVRISEDYDRDIFFRMNTDSFETAVVSMTAECCGAGHYFGCCLGYDPERIIFSARRSGRDRAEITVMSLNISGGTMGSTNGINDNASHLYERSFNKRLLSKYIYDILGLKNGARFSKENIPGGLVCRMNIEALPRGASVFAEKPVDGSGRRLGIEEKIAFFFADIPKAEGNRYTSRSGGYGKNDGEPKRLNNIYREDIENEKSEV